MDLILNIPCIQQVKSDALSSKYRNTGRNKLWTSVQTDVKKKQNKMEREAEKVRTCLSVFIHTEWNLRNFSWHLIT